MCNRLFLTGMIALFLGVQFRAVETFEFNENASRFIEKRLTKGTPSGLAADLTSYDTYDDYWPGAESVMPQRLHRVTPPRWLGFSLLSVGAVLVLTCPCFR